MAELSMTRAQWRGLEEYMGHVELQPGDRLELSTHAGGNVRLLVMDGGTVVDEIEVDPAGNA